jgi:hypothetical protein
LLANVSIRARVEEILAAGAERAEITVEQVLRELAVLGFSDIGKVVRWRPELVYEELEDADNLDQPVRQVLQSRVLVIGSATRSKGPPWSRDHTGPFISPALMPMARSRRLPRAGGSRL